MLQPTLVSGTFSSKSTSEREYAAPENALLAAGMDCWHPRYRTRTTRHISQPAAVLSLSTAMVAATGSHQHPQAECVLCFEKKIKIPAFIASSCTALHNVTV